MSHATAKYRMEPDDISGTRLRGMIKQSLLSHGGSSRSAWEEKVESETGAYEHDSVLEAYDNLSRSQLLRAEAFVVLHFNNPVATATLARAAYDSSLYGGHILNNTILMFKEVDRYRRFQSRQFINSDMDTYRVICGFTEDISRLPKDEQQGRITAAQFMLGHSRSASIDYSWISISKGYESEHGPEEVIQISNPALRNLLYRSPGKADEMLAIKRENPRISAVSLAAVMDGKSAKSLVSGEL